MHPLLVVLAIGALVAAGIWFSHVQVNKRIAAMSGLAASLGWTYSRHDPYGLVDRWDDDPFGRGHSRRAEHVLAGSMRGRPALVFDYSYEETSTDGDGTSRTTTYRFTICAMRLPVPLPPLVVGPENLLTRLGQVFGMSDIELESEDFNRAYKVSCREPKFASDVLHPRTMELLLRCDPRLEFRFDGADVISWSRGRASPGAIVRTTEALATVLDQIPAFVWKDRGIRTA